MINKIDNKKIIIIVTVTITILFIIILNYVNRDEEVVVENIENSQTVENNVQEEEPIIVHITGCVKNQGIIEIKNGSRIADVIEAAGGITEEADISKVNLAYIVKDAQKIYIPSIYDAEDVLCISQESGDNVIVENMEDGSSGMVNINSATQTELEQLPGIGPSTALKIIDYREKNGKFKTKEEIKEIAGIGEAKYNNIKDMIEV